VNLLAKVCITDGLRPIVCDLGSRRSELCAQVVQLALAIRLNLLTEFYVLRL
jgi:hypothetical protein